MNRQGDVNKAHTFFFAGLAGLAGSSRFLLIDCPVAPLEERNGVHVVWGTAYAVTKSLRQASALMNIVANGSRSFDFLRFPGRVSFNHG